MNTRTYLPEGLTVINSDADIYRYQYTEPAGDRDEVDFVIYRDGTVDIAAPDGPVTIPVEVLAWITRLAELRRSS